jgi:hypothetical protein
MKYVSIRYARSRRACPAVRHMREYKARIPIAFRNCEEMIDKFIMLMEDYPDEFGFWVK